MRYKIFFVFFMGLFLFVQEAKSQVHGAVGMNFLFSDFKLGLQGRIMKDLGERFVISGTFTYYLEKSTSIAFDFDARYRLIRIGAVGFEPLLGINIRRFDEFGDTSMNAGLFMTYETDKLTVYFEPKYILDSKPVFVFSTGFYF
ncbi:MAG: hypothetical protein IPL23_02630 [Saprospiraceae bacterium]|nr:hypothetical protein [Saprospiraceae bacterium]MBK8632894.1 hypothetical protein [Saprospiraceae bacterium]MBP7643832.1 hypothetical protein [Saprospiraceae bacterium]